MTTLNKKQLPATVSYNREVYNYQPLMTIVANTYRTPDDIIAMELRKENKKGLKVNVDGSFFLFTTHPPYQQVIEEMELTAD